VLGRAFALPRAQTPLGFAVRRRAPRQQLERVAAQVLHRRAIAAREDQLDAVAGREIGELFELHALGKVLQPSCGVLLLQRELRERFAAALAPRHADDTEMFQQCNHLLPVTGTAYRSPARRVVTAVSRRTPRQLLLRCSTAGIPARECEAFRFSRRKPWRCGPRARRARCECPRRAGAAREYGLGCARSRFRTVRGSTRSSSRATRRCRTAPRARR
jgi:hypothetical protein